jgi:hypothetical protein
MVGAIYLLFDDCLVLGIILIVISVFLFVFGLRGRKRELQLVLKAVDAVDGFSVLIDAISSIIDL